MPYPESCPECGGVFRNTGTHFTARRNEVGRHVLLELGCQNTARRFWWDFTSGNVSADGRATPTRAAALVGAPATNGAAHASNGHASNGHSANGHASNGLTRNGHVVSSTAVAERVGPAAPVVPAAPAVVPAAQELQVVPATSVVETVAREVQVEVAAPVVEAKAEVKEEATPVDLIAALQVAAPAAPVESPSVLPAPAPVVGATPVMVDAFVRQLQLDRLTLRQMRSLLIADEARRAIEVAVGATEATYERLALILFGADLSQLLGKQAPTAAAPSMSAEERLELQREKARIRARLRRAAIKAAKTQ